MFALPDLPYDYTALEPHLDAATLEIHHSKHHAAYVKNLNAALEDFPDLLKKNLVDLISGVADLPEPVRAKVRNQGGGVLNHNLFWKFMTPEKTQPNDKLLSAINSAFQSMDGLKSQLSEKAVSHFGSGWAWLVFASGRLTITATTNQDSPYSLGQIPLLGVDVWEHAYYLKFQNRRADFVSAWWNVVNWTEVSARFMDASA